MDDKNKLEQLYEIKIQFRFTRGQNTSKRYLARFMKWKKRNFMIAYNIQSAFNHDTKLISTIKP